MTIDRDNVRKGLAAIREAGAALQVAGLKPMEMHAAIECARFISEEMTHNVYGGRNAEEMLAEARAVAVEIQQS